MCPRKLQCTYVILWLASIVYLLRQRLQKLYENSLSWLPGLWIPATIPSFQVWTRRFHSNGHQSRRPPEQARLTRQIIYQRLGRYWCTSHYQQERTTFSICSKIPCKVKNLILCRTGKKIEIWLYESMELRLTCCRAELLLGIGTTRTACPLPISILILKLVQHCLSRVCTDRTSRLRTGTHYFSVNSARYAIVKLDVELRELVVFENARVNEITQWRLVDDVTNSESLDSFVLGRLATTAITEN